ncbi:MAG TPA: DUF924 family protein [Thermoanaerobaculia bacterium]|nr:DUF924 family protein [Thermoanaerobaculia bacterium]
MSPTSSDRDSILEFWFGADPADPDAVRAKQPLWFTIDSAVDDEIRRRFGDAWAAATRGELDWAKEARGALAIVILLDQFSRNLQRGKAAAFAHDGRALATATAAIEAGCDQNLLPPERSFLYLPFEHAEAIALQHRSVALFSTLAREGGPDWTWLTEDTLKWARLHLEIIERFGRFPHRNLVLGRAPTAAEERYLAEGGARFGQ